MKQILLAICLCAVAAPASAWEFYTTGPIEPSIVVGIDHQPGSDVLSNSYGMPRGRGAGPDDSSMPQFGLHGMTTGERSDYPCMVEFEWTQMTGGAAPNGDLLNQGRAFTRCGNRGASQRSVEEVSVNHGLGSWATGLTVCSASTDRVKGLRLRGTRYSYDTDAKEIREDGNNRDEFARANCGGNWGTNVGCLPGRIIVGMDVYYMLDRNGRREADSIIGFRLHCRALAVRN